MAFDAFLKISTVPGESMDEKHKDWIEILSFSHGMTQPVSGTKSSAGGATSNRVNMQEFRVSKYIDLASVKLNQACCTGQHIPEVTVELCRASGSKMKYMEYKMTDVIVSAVNSGGAPSGSEDVPVEEVSFSFGKIKWNYTRQMADGKQGGNVAGGWDVTKNMKV